MGGVTKSAEIVEQVYVAVQQWRSVYAAFGVGKGGGCRSVTDAKVLLWQPSTAMCRSGERHAYAVDSGKAVNSGGTIF